jgi:4-hydroxy-tetrahydrodipicolinate synthase
MLRTKHGICRLFRDKKEEKENTMKQFQGAITAIVTPMQGGKIDEKGLIDLIEFQIASGIHGIVPCGTTGESATLSFDG